MVPCPISRPAAKIPIRSQTCWTWFRRWLDRRIAICRSRTSDRSRSRISVTPRGSIAVVGSSRIRTSGSLISASAMPSRWSMPREYVSVRSSARAVSPTDSIASSIASARLVPWDPVQPGGVAEVLAAGEVAVEADAVRQVADPPLDLERATGRIQPDHARLAVGRLGQPEQHQDGRRLAGAVLPEQPEDLAGLDLEVEMVDGDQVAVGLGEAAGPDRGARLVLSLARPARGRARLALRCPALATDPLPGRSRRRRRHRRP